MARELRRRRYRTRIDLPARFGGFPGFSGFFETIKNTRARPAAGGGPHPARAAHPMPGQGAIARGLADIRENGSQTGNRRREVRAPPADPAGLIPAAMVPWEGASKQISDNQRQLMAELFKIEASVDALRRLLNDMQISPFLACKTVLANMNESVLRRRGISGATGSPVDDKRINQLPAVFLADLRFGSLTEAKEFITTHQYMIQQCWFEISKVIEPTGISPIFLLKGGPNEKEYIEAYTRARNFYILAQQRHKLNVLDLYTPATIVAAANGRRSLPVTSSPLPMNEAIDTARVLEIGFYVPEIYYLRSLSSNDTFGSTRGLSELLREPPAPKLGKTQVPEFTVLRNTFELVNAAIAQRALLQSDAFLAALFAEYRRVTDRLPSSPHTCNTPEIATSIELKEIAKILASEPATILRKNFLSYSLVTDAVVPRDELARRYWLALAHSSDPANPCRITSLFRSKWQIQGKWDQRGKIAWFVSIGGLELPLPLPDDLLNEVLVISEDLQQLVLLRSRLQDEITGQVFLSELEEGSGLRLRMIESFLTKPR